MDVAASPTTKNGDKHMNKTDKYIGLDVHQDTTVIAVAEGGRVGEVRVYGSIPGDLRSLEKVLGKLGGENVRLHVVYEAGPTGFLVYRRLRQLEIDCIVVAPSKTPQPKGVRQKTDLRDAVQLARLLPRRLGPAPCRTIHKGTVMYANSASPILVWRQLNL